MIFRYVCVSFFLLLSVAGARTQEIREAIVKVYTVHNVPDYYNPWNMRGTQASTGSGAIISGNRILTNGHVVRDHTFVQVRRFGESRRYQARVVFASHQADLAVLSVDDPAFFEGVEPLELGELPFTQDEVNVYGFPMGGDTLSITKGVVSRIEHQTYAHSSAHLLAVQIDAAVNPGNSGGPAIVNDRIVGVAMQGISQADNIGYIVPVPVIKHFLDDIASGAREGIPSLGIITQRMENPDMRRRYRMAEEETGVLVTHVVHGSAAADFLEVGDVLLRIEREPIADDGTVEFRPKERTSFAYYVQDNQVGDVIDLVVLRDGEYVDLQIPLIHSMERDWLVPMEEYDKLPTYYIYGGVVFVPLNKNLMRMWGNNWFNTAPKEFVIYLNQNVVTDELDEVVVALKVLAADVNQGYHNENHWIIDSVNGERVRNLRHLIELVEAGEEDEFVEFGHAGGNKIVLDREKVRREEDSIMAVYRISKDRSDDLR
jgi:S1-C subfamily serine protease